MAPALATAMTSTVTGDHIVGAILGGAIGDGWGGPYEGGVPHASAQAPNELVVSDDTLLTLATCEAIVEAGAVVPEQIAARFVAWYRDGKLRGLGASTMKAPMSLPSCPTPRSATGCCATPAFPIP